MYIFRRLKLRHKLLICLIAIVGLYHTFSPSGSDDFKARFQSDNGMPDLQLFKQKQPLPAVLPNPDKEFEILQHKMQNMKQEGYENRDKLIENPGDLKYDKNGVLNGKPEDKLVYNKDGLLVEGDYIEHPKILVRKLPESDEDHNARYEHHNARDEPKIRENEHHNANQPPEQLQDATDRVSVDQNVNRNVNQLPGIMNQGDQNANQLPGIVNQGERAIEEIDDVMAFRRERYRNYQERGMVNGPGEMGKPVVLSGDEAKEGERTLRQVGTNLVASGKVSLERAIPDLRIKECKDLRYPKDLPSLSAIIIFSNEPRSPLLRCAHSVVNRTPPEYLKEVILVDDASEREDLLASLDEYVRSTWPDGIVRIVRRRERGGLIRARMDGARAAKGDVLAIMDGHMEVNEGWAEPFLARIKEKQNTIIVPVIDIIKETDFSYHSGGSLPITGFMWNLLYIWKNPKPWDLAGRNKSTDPVRSPTIMGCAFAVNREYFFHIGGFDEGMDIWGQENIELPFRVWLCGGSVELLPCMRMGHMYRRSRPYKYPKGHTAGRNGKRLAEVWMDDYKRIFYLRRPDLKNADAGDLSERLAIKERLQCKPFKWYLDNIEPDKFVFDENVQAWGQVMNPGSRMCMDTMGKNEQAPFDFKVYACEGIFVPSQLMGLSLRGELRMEVKCAESTGREDARIEAKLCHGMKGHQEWSHDRTTGTIVHVHSKKCLHMVNAKNGGALTVKECNGSQEQVWQFSHYL